MISFRKLCRAHHSRLRVCYVRWLWGVWCSLSERGVWCSLIVRVCDVHWLRRVWCSLIVRGVVFVDCEWCVVFIDCEGVRWCSVVVRGVVFVDGDGGGGRGGDVVMLAYLSSLLLCHCFIAHKSHCWSRICARSTATVHAGHISIRVWITKPRAGMQQCMFYRSIEYVKFRNVIVMSTETIGLLPVVKKCRHN